MRSSAFMETKMSGSHGGRKGKSEKPALCRRGEVVEIKSVFGRYSDAEMLSQLKRLALDPRNKELSLDKIQPWYNQTLRVRKALALSDSAFPRRKRKLEQFCKDKLRAIPKFAPDVSVQGNNTKLSRGQLSHASSASCLLNPAGSAESSDKKINPESCPSASLLTFENDTHDRQICLQSSLDDAIDWRSSTKYVVLDSDESVNGSNPLTPENLNNQEAPPLDLFDAIHINVEMQENLPTPRRSIRILNLIGDHLQRKVVPVNPRFQAVVPEWSGPIGSEESSSDDSKWLGTRIWPIEGRNVKTTAREVGKGRLETCSCVSPGSIDCVKRHTLEERLLLLCDLGSAFFTWKFDDMGEQVAKSWTTKDQGTFEALVKNNDNFVKHALKYFPNKSVKAVVSYYLNVFIPRRMAIRTRASHEQVDSDEDEADNYNYLNWGKRCEGSVTLGVPKAVKTLYLRQSS